MSLQKNFEDKVLGGHSLALSINGNIATAAPSAGTYGTCRVGELIYDKTGDDWYVCSVADTTWIKLNS